MIRSGNEQTYDVLRTKCNDLAIKNKVKSAINKKTRSNASYDFKSIIKDVGLHLNNTERRRISDYLRRNIPNGYHMVKNSKGNNQYVPLSVSTDKSASGTVTTITNGKVSTKEISADEARNIIHESTKVFDELIGTMLKEFLEQMDEVHKRLSRVFFP